MKNNYSNSNSNSNSNKNESILLSLIYTFYKNEKVIKKYEYNKLLFIITSYRICRLENGEIKTIFFNQGIDYEIINYKKSNSSACITAMKISNLVDEFIIPKFTDKELFAQILDNTELKKQTQISKKYHGIDINKIHMSLLNILDNDEEIIFINSNKYEYDNSKNIDYNNMIYGLSFLPIFLNHNLVLKLVVAIVLSVLLYYIFLEKNKKIFTANQMITNKRIIDLDKYQKVTIIELNDMSCFIVNKNQTMKILSKTKKETIVLQTNESTNDISNILQKYLDLMVI